MNWKAVRWALALVCLVAGACGGSGDGELRAGQVGEETTSTGAPAESTTLPPTTSQASTTTRGTTASTARTTTSSSAAEGSVLQRRDARPGDVKELGERYLGGPPPRGSECVFGVSDPPGSGPVVIVDPKLFLGEATTICVSRFTGTARISVEVRRRDNSVWNRQVSPVVTNDAPVPFTEFPTLPGDATGTYTVTATQGSLRATAMFVVDYATNQHILVVAESPARGVPSVRRGTPIHIGLAGWRAGQRVDLSLHYSPSTTPGGDARFIALISVTVDARGQRLYELPTRSDDARGCYVVNTRPAEEPQGALGRLGPSIVEFCLT